METENLLQGIPVELRDEFCTTLVSEPGLRIERIISTGQASPPGFWYDQDEDEWVLVLEGCAVVEFADGDSVELQRGSHLRLPAHCRHRVAWTDPNRPTVWLAVFFRRAD